ncbi:MAG: PAS/PAC sensor signal transduction histidine [Geobacteraceae bacterium]|nr:MAG: PAS/PAC sensor signal transduction histidine [Geobacteraceae bacterium]
MDHDTIKGVREEETLKLGEQRIHALLESVPLGVYECNTDGLVTFANESYARITGYGKDEILEMHVWDFMEPGPQKDSLPAYLHRLVQEQAPPTPYSCRNLTKDGRFIDVQIDWTYRRNEGGQVIGFVCIISDTTERKRAESAHRLNESRLDALARLYEMTDAALHEITNFALEEAVRLTKSTVGYLSFVNEDETVLTMYSWSRHAMKECRISETPLEYPVAATGLWGEAVRQRKPVITNDYQATPYKKGYPEGHVELRRHMNAPIFDNGRIVIVAGVGNKEEEYDETDVRQLSLLMQGMWQLIQHRRTIDALRNSEERYRALFEGANDAIFTIRNGRVVKCNRKTLEMFSCSAEEFIGRTPEYFSPPVQPDGRDSAEKAREKIMLALAGTPQVFEWQHHRFDGTLFEGEVSLNRIEHRDKAELQAIIRDITERKEIERMKDQMISAVSHEMRTPLTVMLGFTEFLLENRVDEVKLKDYLGTMHKETTRLNELISNFLDLQRIKAQKVIYSFKPLTVRSLLADADELFAVASKKHRIVVDVHVDLPPVLGDRARLLIVLNNLLSNAIKYSPKGGKITLGALQDEDSVVLWVKDEGMGIPPELLDRIFDRFYRVDNADHRTTSGTGLGLAVIKEIIHSHGGQVRVESTVGKGSTFFVSLPVAKEPPAINMGTH